VSGQVGRWQDGHDFWLERLGVGVFGCLRIEEKRAMTAVRLQCSSWMRMECVWVSNCEARGKMMANLLLLVLCGR
jgi:hypothetical protein